MVSLARVRDIVCSVSVPRKGEGDSGVSWISAALSRPRPGSRADWAVGIRRCSHFEVSGLVVVSGVGGGELGGSERRQDRAKTPASRITVPNAMRQHS